jgi:hypothetical protein
LSGAAGWTNPEMLQIIHEFGWVPFIGYALSFIARVALKCELPGHFAMRHHPLISHQIVNFHTLSIRWPIHLFI